jgi:hypothetical protein
MKKKINPVNGLEIDYMFDGHIEKPLSKMTPEEKLNYLWMQIEFKWAIRNAVKQTNSKTRK